MPALDDGADHRMDGGGVVPQEVLQRRRPLGDPGAGVEQPRRRQQGLDVHGYGGPAHGGQARHRGGEHGLSFSVTEELLLVGLGDAEAEHRADSGAALWRAA